MNSGHKFNSLALILATLAAGASMQAAQAKDGNGSSGGGQALTFESGEIKFIDDLDVSAADREILPNLDFSYELGRESASDSSLPEYLKSMPLHSVCAHRVVTGQIASIYLQSATANIERRLQSKKWNGVGPLGSSKMRARLLANLQAMRWVACNEALPQLPDFELSQETQNWLKTSANRVRSITQVAIQLKNQVVFDQGWLEQVHASRPGLVTYRIVESLVAHELLLKTFGFDTPRAKLRQMSRELRKL